MSFISQVIDTGQPLGITIGAWSCFCFGVIMFMRAWINIWRDYQLPTIRKVKDDGDRTPTGTES